MIVVTLACGHPKLELGSDSNQPPVCPVCGERRVRDVKAEPPRFRGVVLGPSARTEALAGVAISVAPSGPLQLKEQG